MPGRRNRECKKVGCYALTDSADGYCEQHKKEKWAAGDERRKSARERGYDAQWEKYRKEFLINHPLCEDCLSKKILRAATVVDHIVAHKGDERLFWDGQNHQALCKQCHDMKTIQEVCAAAGRIIPGYLRGLPKRRYLKPSVPVYVAAGAPGSGTNLFVARHIKPGELLIDLDDIIRRLSGQNPYEVNRVPYLVAAYWLRDRMINALHDNKENYAACWITGMFASPDDRRKLHSELDAKVYVISTDWMRCRLNIKNNCEYKGHESQYIKLAEKWFLNFKSCPFDNFVSI